jgi:hypothetical protein
MCRFHKELLYLGWISKENFNRNLRLWYMSRVEYIQTFRQTLKMPFSGRMYTGGFTNPYIDQAVGSEWDVKDMTVGTEELAAIRYVAKTWLRKRCDERVCKGH